MSHLYISSSELSIRRYTPVETVTNCHQLKVRVNNKDGFEPSAACPQLKVEASNGKRYLTDIADTEQLFRLISSKQKVH